MMLVAIAVIPLVAAAVAALDRRAGGTATLAGALAVLALSAGAALQVVNAPAHALTVVRHWVGLDALGALILLLVAFVGAAAALYSLGYMRSEGAGGLRRYYVNFNLFLFSMLLVPLMQEPNLAWIAIELTTLFSVLLVGFRKTPEAIEAAWKYVVLTIMGASIALLGFVVLFWAMRAAGGGEYSWESLLAAAPHMSPMLLRAAFVLILVGFGAKVGLVPLHTWLPDAHSQAPTPVCALLSGVETTTVLYVILRLFPVMEQTPGDGVRGWAVGFGLLSVGVAAFLLLNVRDYKRLFAFSTVEHMGIILTAAGLGGMSAHFAATLQIMAHTLTKSFCFFAAGAVLMALGTQDIAQVRGLIRRRPGAGAALLFGGLALGGAPPFALFLSEFSVLKAGFSAGDYVLAGLLLLFIAIAFFAIMNHVSRMVFGPAQDVPEAEPARLPVPCVLTLVALAIPVLVLGVYIPAPLQALLKLAAAGLGG